jgi:tetratricopeptide (TPR) repeat protein
MRILVGLLAAVVLGVAAPQTAGETTGDTAVAASLRTRGLELGYNLDHDEALATFKAAIAAAPGEPAGYRLAAAGTWIHLLFRQGVITVDDYLGQARASIQRPAPDPVLNAAFYEHIRRAIALSEERLRTRPRDADAHYQVGAAFGFQASYTATIEGRILGSLGPARRAYSEHERVLELDPQRRDAGLVVGMYRYAISELPLPMRLMAKLVGFGSGREQGLRLVEAAASDSSDVQANALFTLILLYNREARYDDAIKVIRRLQERFPRNRLLWLEAAGTELRAGRPAAARAWVEAGMARLARDPRPHATGEDSRWHYTYGTALVALKESDAAERELRAALPGATRDWVRGRVHKELGKLADLAGDRGRAIGEYRQADALCRADKDTACADELKTLIKRGYKGRGAS